MRPGDGHRSRIWAPVLRQVDVTLGGHQITLHPGTWVESAVFMGVPGMRPPRSAFGATSPDALIARRIGRVPDVGEVVVLSDGAAPLATQAAPASPPAHALSARAQPRTPASDVHGRVLCDMASVRNGEAWETPPGAPVLVITDPSVDVPEGAVLELLACMESTRADVVLPLQNIGMPLCLPVGKSEPRSPARPMPGGRSPSAIAEALRRLPAQHIGTASDRIAAALFSPDGLRKWRAGEPVDFVVTCVNAFAWVSPTLTAFIDLPARPLPTDVSASSVAERAREVIAEAPPGGLPVVFVCDGVGPVGGTQVILNVVDALNDLGGISASVVHKFTGNYPHSFVSKAAPLPLAKGEIVNAVTDRLGWKRGAPGIVVATSWGTGDTVRAICERNPALTPVAFWQDREDLFERHDGKPAGAGEFSAYLAIRHRVAVSRWILESAEAEGLIGARESDAIRQVVWPAVDPAFTSQPPPERTDSTDRPVRILAMWRPMTAVRRGMPRLAKLYDDLRAAYRGKKAGRVSLEVFGWSEGVPTGVVSHGHLTTAQVAALMREVDIVVEPSEFQGFGLPGMEAIACGAALVTTPCRGPQEYTSHGFNAIVADDHDSLLPAVRSLVDDPRALRLIQRGAAGTWPPVAWAERAREFSTVLHIAAGLAARDVSPTT
jgi:hypothetical protein